MSEGKSILYIFFHVYLLVTANFLNNRRFSYTTVTQIKTRPRIDCVSVDSCPGNYAFDRPFRGNEFLC